MSVAACAALVERGDPDRFRAVMAAPVAARAVLFPLYAFNLEVARAPWVTAEPLIAEMRLQWWRDALDEIAQGGPVRRHEVTGPLAEVVSPQMAATLTRLVEARREDIGPGAQEAGAMVRYLRATGGTLTEVAGRALGAPSSEVDALQTHGMASAMANWLQALPTLRAAGKRPFGADTPTALQDLADQGLAALRRGPRLSRAGRIAALAGWSARAVLTQAQRHPDRILAGQVRSGPVATSARLIWARLCI